MPKPAMVETALRRLPRYDRRRSYQWNYEHAPEPVTVDVPAVPGSWTFCGRRVASPLGIAAGPLLNGRWVLYYASLGFDVLTYKTVRSVARRCYPLPNLVPVVTTTALAGKERWLPASRRMQGSWAVSFGMPSQSPEVWRRDVEWTRKRLPRGKLLSVSVVGTVQPDWSLEDLADDYAQCARWAVESGADCVEANFSCPNVSTCDGQLYQQPQAAALVAGRVRDAVGKVPFLVKIGHVQDADSAAELIAALAPYADALSMTNSVATRVRDRSGRWVFDGQRRGICGAATREASIAQTRLFHQQIARTGAKLRIIGVGGVSTADDVLQYRNAGAEAVHLATAAMIDPLVGVRIRRELASRG